MKSLFSKLVLPVFVLFAAPLCYSQGIATLNCNDEGGYPSVSAPLYAFTLNTDRTTNVLNAIVYLDISFFPTLLSTEGGYYTNCTISAGKLNFSMDTTYFEDVTANGAISGVQGPNAAIYTSSILTFVQLTVGAVTVSAKASPEARAQAVAALRAKGLAIPKGIGQP